MAARYTITITGFKNQPKRASKYQTISLFEHPDRGIGCHCNLRSRCSVSGREKYTFNFLLFCLYEVSWYCYYYYAGDDDDDENMAYIFMISEDG